MASQMDLQREIEDTENRILDAVDEVVRFWGFKGVYGRVWGVLYLSRQPMDMDDIRVRLGLSAGSVSMTLKELQDLGVVVRLRNKRGGRNQYIAETNFWKMISRILDRREKRLVDDATAEIRRGANRLNTLARNADPDTARALRDEARRARRLEGLGGVVHAMIESLISVSRMDASMLKAAKLPAQLKKALM